MDIIGDRNNWLQRKVEKYEKVAKYKINSIANIFVIRRRLKYLEKP